MRKRLAVLLAAVLALSACGGGDSAGSDGPVSLRMTIWTGNADHLALFNSIADDYRKVALVEPLKRQLKLKKDRLELALKAYAAAADYGVAEVSTAATFHTAELYRDFGRALMSSQRPNVPRPPQ